MSLPIYETVAGRSPSAFLGMHPSGDFAALQVSIFTDGNLQERGGVWDANTGKLVWLPDEAHALCWMPDGDQVALLHSHYQHSPDHPHMIVTPLQREYTHFFERWSWPGRELVASCPISLPTGWLDWIAVSPKGTIAVFRWMEQDCAGYEFIALSVEGDAQVPGQGVRFDSNLIMGPTFSPDGRYLALTRGRYAWWNEVEDVEAPAEGGEYQAGEVIIHDLDVGTRRTLPVTVHLEAGWLPDDPDSGRWEVLGIPLFVTTSEFTVRLPNGDDRRFSTAT